MSRASIALSMIVKDESHVIARCLDSVRDIIDYWIVADTGSADNTRELVREQLADVPGQIIDIPWTRFDECRNQSLEAARQKADYCLIIDADEVLEFAPDFSWPELTADAYDIKTRLGSIEYWRRQLVASRLPWRFTGAVHERLGIDQAFELDDLQGVINVPLQDSARNRNGNKYERDVEILSEIYRQQPDHGRTAYVLGQSYRDLGDPANAARVFLERTELPEDEENAPIWYSWYQLGLMFEQLGRPVGEVIEAYERAFSLKPDRAEPLVRIIRYFISQNDLKTSLELFDLIRYLPCPEKDFAVEPGVYSEHIPEIARLLDHAQNGR